jgi:hypothetical protein
MRRLLTGLIAAAIVLAPLSVWAGNQDVAERIAKNLRSSGKMSDYQVAVKFQDGTAWLRGHVSSPEQLSTAMKIAFQTQGVNRVVNELSIVSGETAPRERQRATATRYVPQPTDVSGVRPAMAQQRSSASNRVAYASSPMPAGQPAPMDQGMPMGGPPRPMYSAAAQGGPAPVRYDQPCVPNYAWPSYAAYPNYAALTYPKQYSPTAWPYIGPFYPYPQVPLEWRKVTLEWDDGWWFLDFKDQPSCRWFR